MRYKIMVEGLREAVFYETVSETDDIHVALASACVYWARLSESEQQNVRVKVIDTAAGTVERVLTNEVYWTMIDYGFPAFYWDGVECVAIEAPRYVTEPDWSEGGTACWFEAKAIHRCATQDGTKSDTYLVHWDIENPDHKDIDGGTALDLVDWDYPANVERDGEQFDIKEYMK